MDHEHQGIFAVTLPDEKVPDYKIATSYSSGSLGGFGWLLGPLGGRHSTTRTGTCRRWASSTCT